MTLALGIAAHAWAGLCGYSQLGAVAAGLGAMAAAFLVRELEGAEVVEDVEI